MMDLGTNITEEAQQFRIEVLKTLATLPIPNRSMLMDSKVLEVVEKWSKQLYHSASGESPEDDQSKLKSISEDVEMVESGEKTEKTEVEVVAVKTEENKEEPEVKKEIKTEDVDQSNLISELAENLLTAWSSLKEVFRIPKKERIEQMKEHEREAGMKSFLSLLSIYNVVMDFINFVNKILDRDYKENADSSDGESKDNSSYDR